MPLAHPPGQVGHQEDREEAMKKEIWVPFVIHSDDSGPVQQDSSLLGCLRPKSHYH